MVRWRETIDFLHDRTVERAVELGPGDVLTNLMERNVPSITTHAVGTPRELEAYMNALAEELTAHENGNG